MPEIVLNLTPEEANGVLIALGKFPIEQAGALYSKVQYQVSAQLQSVAQQQAPEVPSAPVVVETEGGATE